MEAGEGQREEGDMEQGREGNRLFQMLAAAVFVGAILVLGWFLFGSMTIPRFTTAGPVVRNGVAAVVACGKKQGMAGIEEVARYADEPRTGSWDHVRKGECTVWYHHPPGLEQRHARQERADR
jgi:hypothetical protein